MSTRILFFGKLKEPAGGDTRDVTLPDTVTNGASLIDWLCAEDDYLRDALTGAGVRLSVDQAIVSLETPFQNPTEVAFLPTFSGG